MPGRQAVHSAHALVTGLTALDSEASCLRTDTGAGKAQIGEAGGRK